VITLLNRAPHPNAAKVFINWVLSREGQTAFQKVSVADNAASGNSMREDIPKDIIPPGYWREPDLVQVEALSGEMIDTRPIIKLVDEILGGKP
jgi:ABC-type Fe3+ transport system substrate-binding protein